MRQTPSMFGIYVILSLGFLLIIDTLGRALERLGEGSGR
jgi:hypothetical protein